MLVAEGPADGFVCEGYVVGCEDISLSSELGEFLSEIFALLGRDLRGLQKLFNGLIHGQQKN